MARIILAECGNGYCGCEAEDLFIFSNLTDDKSSLMKFMLGLAITQSLTLMFISVGMNPTPMKTMTSIWKSI